MSKSRGKTAITRPKLLDWRPFDPINQVTKFKQIAKLDPKLAQKVKKLQYSQNKKVM